MKNEHLKKICSSTIYFSGLTLWVCFKVAFWQMSFLPSFQSAKPQLLPVNKKQKQK